MKPSGWYACVPLLALAAASCTPAAPPVTPTPVIETVEVTVEVTRLVEVPVTVTPSPTPEVSETPSSTPTISLTPSITPTPNPPRVTALLHASCNFGPGAAYLYKYSVLETSRMEVIGRNLDGSWLHVQAIGGWNPCWVKAEYMRFYTGSIDVVPIVHTTLPYSNLYGPPEVSTNRVGNEVTIFWQPVWMTEDDYRGYLIEAWVCRGGQQVFTPIDYVTSYAENNAMMAVKVVDEAGCLVPSSARIYSVEKHGYTRWRLVPWPAHEPTATATRTHTSTPTRTATATPTRPTATR